MTIVVERKVGHVLKLLLHVAAKSLEGFFAPRRFAEENSRRFPRQSASDEVKGRKVKSKDDVPERASKFALKAEKQELRASGKTANSLQEQQSYTVTNVSTVRTNEQPLQISLTTKPNNGIIKDANTILRGGGKVELSTQPTLAKKIQTTESPLRDKPELSSTPSLTTSPTLGSTKGSSKVTAASKQLEQFQFTSNASSTLAPLQVTTQWIDKQPSTIGNATTKTLNPEETITNRNEELSTTTRSALLEGDSSNTRHSEHGYEKDSVSLSMTLTPSGKDLQTTIQDFTLTSLFPPVSTLSSLDFQNGNRSEYTQEEPRGQTGSLESSPSTNLVKATADTLKYETTQTMTGTPMHEPTIDERTWESSLKVSRLPVSFSEPMETSTSPSKMEFQSTAAEGHVTPYEANYVTEAPTTQGTIKKVDGPNVVSSGSQVEISAQATVPFVENSNATASQMEPPLKAAESPVTPHEPKYMTEASTTYETVMKVDGPSLASNHSNSDEEKNSTQSAIMETIMKDSSTIFSSKDGGPPEEIATLATVPYYVTTGTEIEKGLEFTNGAQTLSTSASQQILPENETFDTTKLNETDGATEATFVTPSSAEQFTRSTISSTSLSNVAVSEKLSTSEVPVEFQTASTASIEGNLALEQTHSSEGFVNAEAVKDVTLIYTITSEKPTTVVTTKKSPLTELDDRDTPKTYDENVKQATTLRNEETSDPTKPTIIESITDAPTTFFTASEQSISAATNATVIPSKENEDVLKYSQGLTDSTLFSTLYRTEMLEEHTVTPTLRDSETAPTSHAAPAVSSEQSSSTISESISLRKLDAKDTPKHFDNTVSTDIDSDAPGFAVRMIPANNEVATSDITTENTDFEIKLSTSMSQWNSIDDVKPTDRTADQGLYTTSSGTEEATELPISPAITDFRDNATASLTTSSERSPSVITFPPTSFPPTSDNEDTSKQLDTTVNIETDLKEPRPTEFFTIDQGKATSTVVPFEPSDNEATFGTSVQDFDSNATKRSSEAANQLLYTLYPKDEAAELTFSTTSVISEDDSTSTTPSTYELDSPLPTFLINTLTATEIFDGAEKEKSKPLNEELDLGTHSVNAEVITESHAYAALENYTEILSSLANEALPVTETSVRTESSVIENLNYHNTERWDSTDNVALAEGRDVTTEDYLHSSTPPETTAASSYGVISETVNSSIKIASAPDVYKSAEVNNDALYPVTQEQSTIRSSDVNTESSDTLPDNSDFTTQAAIITDLIERDSVTTEVHPVSGSQENNEADRDTPPAVTEGIPNQLETSGGMDTTVDPSLSFGNIVDTSTVGFKAEREYKTDTEVPTPVTTSKSDNEDLDSVNPALAKPPAVEPLPEFHTDRSSLLEESVAGTEPPTFSSLDNSSANYVPSKEMLKLPVSLSAEETALNLDPTTVVEIPSVTESLDHRTSEALSDILVTVSYDADSQSEVAGTFGGSTTPKLTLPVNEITYPTPTVTPDESITRAAELCSLDTLSNEIDLVTETPTVQNIAELSSKENLTTVGPVLEVKNLKSASNEQHVTPPEFQALKESSNSALADVTLPSETEGVESTSVLISNKSLTELPEHSNVDHSNETDSVPETQTFLDSSGTDPVDTPTTLASVLEEEHLTTVPSYQSATTLEAPPFTESFGNTLQETPADLPVNLPEDFDTTSLHSESLNVSEILGNPVNSNHVPSLNNEDELIPAITITTEPLTTQESYRHPVTNSLSSDKGVVTETFSDSPDTSQINVDFEVSSEPPIFKSENSDGINTFTEISTPLPDISRNTESFQGVKLEKPENSSLTFTDIYTTPEAKPETTEETSNTIQNIPVTGLAKEIGSPQGGPQEEQKGSQPISIQDADPLGTKFSLPTLENVPVMETTPEETNRTVAPDISSSPPNNSKNENVRVLAESTTDARGYLNAGLNDTATVPQTDEHEVLKSPYQVTNTPVKDEENWDSTVVPPTTLSSEVDAAITTLSNISNVVTKKPAELAKEIGGPQVRPQEDHESISTQVDNPLETKLSVLTFEKVPVMETNSEVTNRPVAPDISSTPPSNFENENVPQDSTIKSAVTQASEDSTTVGYTSAHDPAVDILTSETSAAGKEDHRGEITLSMLELSTLPPYVLSIEESVKDVLAESTTDSRGYLNAGLNYTATVPQMDNNEVSKSPDQVTNTPVKDEGNWDSTVVPPTTLSSEVDAAITTLPNISNVVTNKPAELAIETGSPQTRPQEDQEGPQSISIQDADPPETKLSVLTVDKVPVMNTASEETNITVAPDISSTPPSNLENENVPQDSTIKSAVTQAFEDSTTVSYTPAHDPAVDILTSETSAAGKEDHRGEITLSMLELSTLPPYVLSIEESVKDVLAESTTDSRGYLNAGLNYTATVPQMDNNEVSKSPDQVTNTPVKDEGNWDSTVVPPTTLSSEVDAAITTLPKISNVVTNKPVGLAKEIGGPQARPQEDQEGPQSISIQDANTLETKLSVLTLEKVPVIETTSEETNRTVAPDISSTPPSNSENENVPQDSTIKSAVTSASDYSTNVGYTPEDDPAVDILTGEASASGKEKQRGEITLSMLDLSTLPPYVLNIDESVKNVAAELTTDSGGYLNAGLDNTATVPQTANNDVLESLDLVTNTPLNGGEWYSTVEPPITQGTEVDAATETLPSTSNVVTNKPASTESPAPTNIPGYADLGENESLVTVEPEISHVTAKLTYNFNAPTNALSTAEILDATSAELASSLTVSTTVSLDDTVTEPVLEEGIDKFRSTTALSLDDGEQHWASVQRPTLLQGSELEISTPPPSKYNILVEKPVLTMTGNLSSHTMIDSEEEDSEHDRDSYPSSHLPMEDHEAIEVVESAQQAKDQSSNKATRGSISSHAGRIQKETENESDGKIYEAVVAVKPGPRDEEELESYDMSDPVKSNETYEDESREDEEEQEKLTNQEKVTKFTRTYPPEIQHSSNTEQTYSEEKVKRYPTDTLVGASSTDSEAESDEEDTASTSQEEPSMANQRTPITKANMKPNYNLYKTQSTADMADDSVSSELPLEDSPLATYNDISESSSESVETSKVYSTTPSSSKGRSGSRNSQPNSAETYAYQRVHYTTNIPSHTLDAGLIPSSEGDFNEAPSFAGNRPEEHFFVTMGSESHSYSSESQKHNIGPLSYEDHSYENAPDGIEDTPPNPVLRLANIPGRSSGNTQPSSVCHHCNGESDSSQATLSAIKALLASVVYVPAKPSLPHAASSVASGVLHPSVGPTALPSPTFISSLAPTSSSILPTATRPLGNASRAFSSWPTTTTLVSNSTPLHGEEIYYPTGPPTLSISTTLPTNELRMKTKSYTFQPSTNSFSNPSTPVWFPREQGALPRNLAMLTKEEKKKDMLQFFSRWRNKLKILSPQPSRLTLISNTNSMYLKSMRTSVSANTPPSHSTVSQVPTDSNDGDLTDFPIEPRILPENQAEIPLSLDNRQDITRSSFTNLNIVSTEPNIRRFSTEPQTRMPLLVNKQTVPSADQPAVKVVNNEIGPKSSPKTLIGKLNAKVLIRRRTMVSLSVVHANTSRITNAPSSARTLFRKTFTVQTAMAKYNASAAAGLTKKPIIIRSALQSRQNLVSNTQKSFRLYSTQRPFHLMTTAPYRAVLKASGRSALFAKMIRRKS